MNGDGDDGSNLQHKNSQELMVGSCRNGGQLVPAGGNGLVFGISLVCDGWSRTLGVHQSSIFLGSTPSV